jgi:thiol-disulfide isomerase/thioredoxin
MKKIWIVPAVTAAGALGFFAHKWYEGRSITEATVATPAPEEAASAPEKPPVAIPDTLPEFSLADGAGKMRSLSEWSGRPLLVNFWGTWCPPCRREIPLLNALRKEGRVPRFEIIGIAIDFRDDVLKYAEQTPIDYPSLIGEDQGIEVLKLLGMDQTPLPISIFADRQHRILTVKIGELHRDEADLILEKLAAFDEGKLGLPDARAQLEEGLKALAADRAKAEAAGSAAPAKQG